LNGKEGIMKKIILIVLLMATVVNAVSFSLTKDEIFFEPGKPIKFSFVIKNTAGHESKISIEQNFGKLKEYSSSLPKEITLQVNERANFEFTISPPSNLPYGIYPLFVTVKETQGTARSAVNAQFTVINPFPVGTPHLNFRVDEVKNGTAPLALTIRNIGMTPLETTPVFSVNDGEKEITTASETIYIPPLEKKIIYSKLQNVSNGKHTFFVKAGETEANYTQTSGNIILELPLNVTIPQKVTTEITLPVKLIWNKPITANITWRVYRQGRGYLVNEEEQFSLVPGENQITYKAAIRSAQNGKYRSKLASANPVINHEFEVTIDDKLKPKVILPDKPETTQEISTGEITKISKKDNTKTIVLLVAGAGLLLLAAGVNRARKNESA